MKVLFFAQARVAAGRDQYEIDVRQGITEGEFWILLVRAFPALASVQGTARLARHETYLEKGEMLDPCDEIAVLPPVSGG